MKIYLAGKVERECWRHDIVDGLHSACCRMANHDFDQGWPPFKKAILGIHDYVGPFFMACGHGLTHGDDSHGVMQVRYEHSNDLFDTDFRDAIRRCCLKAIEAADLVYAWIEDPTCYGTLFELGYAKAKGKTVAIAYPSMDQNYGELRDLWFSVGAADQKIKATTPLAGLSHALASFGWIELARLARTNYQAYLQTPHWKATRELALARAQYRCQTCYGDLKLNVHHRTYDRVGREEPEDLTVLCDSCHSVFHANRKLTTGARR